MQTERATGARTGAWRGLESCVFVPIAGRGGDRRGGGETHVLIAFCVDCLPVCSDVDSTIRRRSLAPYFPMLTPPPPRM
ncbi:unnamed protein product, partial [Nesidiocoris tenuis]